MLFRSDGLDPVVPEIDNDKGQILQQKADADENAKSSEAYSPTESPPEPPSSVSKEAPSETQPDSHLTSAQDSSETQENSLKAPDGPPSEPDEEPRKPPRPFPVPDWLLENCITLREAWEDLPDSLILLGEESFDPETGVPTKAAANKIKCSQEIGRAHV